MKQQKKKNILASPMLYVIVAFVLLRILIGYYLGIWYQPNQAYDDTLMIEYACLRTHFLLPSKKSLLKLISYPFFLKAVDVVGVPYTICLSILWVMSAFAVFYVVGKITEKKVIRYFSLFYCMYLPVAFDFWCGLRLYRNSIIAPFCILCFCGMICLVIEVLKYEKSTKRLMLTALITGVIFTFTYYIKEDGVWLLACLLLCTIIAIACNTRKKLKAYIIILIPLIVFAFGTNCYKAINYHYFGVYETETRTNGELGDFVKNVYKIESEQRTCEIWAPKDAIEKAFDASPTLSEHPELLEAICETPWFGYDIEENPITGDFLTWVLRDALDETGLWVNEKQVQEFFEQVNDEIEQAFDDGVLKKDDRFQLLSSSGGYTWDEIKSLKTEVFEGFLGAVLLKEYSSDLSIVDNKTIQDYYSYVEIATKLTNEGYLADYSLLHSQNKVAKIITNIIFEVYRIINIGLVLLSFFSVVMGLIRVIYNLKRFAFFVKKEKRYIGLWLTGMIFAGISVMYSFGIGWFSVFIFSNGINNVILNFYNISLPVLLMLCYLFNISAIYEYPFNIVWDRVRGGKKHGKNSSSYSVLQ